jgi:hypothetical protein
MAGSAATETSSDPATIIPNFLPNILSSFDPTKPLDRIRHGFDVEGPKLGLARVCTIRENPAFRAMMFPTISPS